MLYKGSMMLLGCHLVPYEVWSVVDMQYVFNIIYHLGWTMILNLDVCKL